MSAYSTRPPVLHRHTTWNGRNERLKAQALAEEAEMQEYKRRVAMAEARAKEMVENGPDMASSIPVKEAEPSAAEWLTKEMPSGQGYSAHDTAELVKTMKVAFETAALE